MGSKIIYYFEILQKKQDIEFIDLFCSRLFKSITHKLYFILYHMCLVQCELIGITKTLFTRPIVFKMVKINPISLRI